MKIRFKADRQVRDVNGVLQWRPVEVLCDARYPAFDLRVEWPKEDTPAPEPPAPIWPRCECGGVGTINASGGITRTCIRCGKTIQPEPPAPTCPTCRNTRVISERVGRVFETDSPDEIGDAYRTVCCPDCSGPAPTKEKL